MKGFKIMNIRARRLLTRCWSIYGMRIITKQKCTNELPKYNVANVSDLQDNLKSSCKTDQKGK